MKSYNLNFIDDENLFRHVEDTTSKYRFSINLKEFNKNIVDPIKLTFDSKIYGKSLEEMVDIESLRQIDKSNANHIGYFHQNIFKYLGEGWEVPEQGYDVVNETLKIYAEVKNKHNTMNSSSSQKTYMKMQHKILRDDEATCYLVEVIAKKSQDITWETSIDGEKLSNKNIRRISIDKFYEVVTGEKFAFRNLCQALPIVINDVIEEQVDRNIDNSVFDELTQLSPNLMKSIYLLSFKEYQGFSDLMI